jgi:glycosyltransferase involved in cell wall biosynthesis
MNLGKIALVTNIPVPYRVPVYRKIVEAGIDLSVVYLAPREPDRFWTLPQQDNYEVTLASRVITFRGRHIHIGSGIGAALDKLSPSMVVTTGYNPPHLRAFHWAIRNRRPHIVQTDGSVESESHLTAVHRAVRRAVWSRSSAFVAASASGVELLARGGAPRDAIFRSPLSSPLVPAAASHEKNIDILFCGRLEPVKRPEFLLDVAAAAAQRLGRKITVTYVGVGKLESALRLKASDMADWVDAEFSGFLQSTDLPSYYARARIFALPSIFEPWGLVVNEAAAAGLPILVSPEVGAGAELVVEGRNGWRLEVSVPDWVNKVVELLSDDALRNSLGSRSRGQVEAHSIDAAAEGLRSAFEFVRQNVPPSGDVRGWRQVRGVV